jgi:integrase/recombinase XerD
MKKRAKTITTEQLNRVLQIVAERSHSPIRDYAVLMLSFRAGLRIGEIAGLNWEDVTDASGAVRQDCLEVPARCAKKGKGRTVPMHPALYATLVHLQRQMLPEHTRPLCPIIRSSDNRTRVSANTLQHYVARLFRSMGLGGVTSHSGRRTFITALARTANQHGCSLRDVQRIAGHEDIETTEAYIDPSIAVGKLVASL